MEVWIRVVSLAIATSACGARTTLDITDAGPLPRRTDVLRIATGVGASCALREGGRLTCWGLEVGWGRRPMLPAHAEWEHLEPVDIVTIPGAIDVGLGSHWCVLLDDGRVMCWGNNCAGQLGTLGDGGLHRTPDPIVVPGVEGAVELAVGFAHTCIRRESGQVWCWGNNEHGQLGDGTFSTEPLFPDCVETYHSTGRSGRPEPAPVVGLDDAVAITAGRFHTCALRAAGRVACWGRNDRGQLGDGSRSNSADPVPAAFEGAEEVAVGGWFTCARRGGEVWCWGDNRASQLGDGTETDSPLPVRVEGLEDARRIDLGIGFVCAIRQDAGVVCWGYGIASGLEWFSPRTRPRPGPVPGADPAMQIASGPAHSCLLTLAAEVQCWGDEGVGELGFPAYRGPRGEAWPVSLP